MISAPPFGGLVILSVTSDYFFTKIEPFLATHGDYGGVLILVISRN